MKRIVAKMMLVLLLIGMLGRSFPVFADFNEIDPSLYNVNIVNDSDLRTKAINQFNTHFENGETWLEKEYYDFNSLKLAQANGYYYATMSQYDNVLSTITIEIDGKSMKPLEVYLSEDSGYFSIEVYNGGEFFHHEVTDVKYMSNDEVLEGIDNLNQVAYFENQGYKSRGLDVRCFLAVSGAGVAVSKLITATCGTPCVFGPQMCAVCLGSVIVIGGGGVIGAVFACWK